MSVSANKTWRQIFPGYSIRPTLSLLKMEAIESISLTKSSCIINHAHGHLFSDFIFSWGVCGVILRLCHGSNWSGGSSCGGGGSSWEGGSSFCGSSSGMISAGRLGGSVKIGRCLWLTQGEVISVVIGVGERLELGNLHGGEFRNLHGGEFRWRCCRCSFPRCRWK
jgi:hypothetical protein